MSDVTDWVAEKLARDAQRLRVVDRTAEDFLVIEAEDDYTFMVAVLGVRGVIEVSHVQPLFAGVKQPQLVVNVPSDTLWSGPAIDFIHSVPAAFGKFGDVDRAAASKAAVSFRDKNMGFFINAIEQHENVASVSYVYDSVLRVDCRGGVSLNVAVIDAYNMSAEDVRNAKSRVGDFDVVVKSSSYGSISEQAAAAAETMGAQALKFGELMRYLAR